MKPTRRIIAIPLLAAMLCSSPVSAFGRDSDGSRMQARPMELGDDVADQVSPPTDNVDWRYIRLAEATDVAVDVKATPSSTQLRVTLTDAMGKAIARGTTTDGTFTTRRRLDPGLYYIAVSGKAKASYKLSVR